MLLSERNFNHAGKMESEEDVFLQMTPHPQPRFSFTNDDILASTAEEASLQADQEDTVGTDSPDGLVADIGKISLDDRYMLIAAIDFGTTFSAYAFSFRCSPDHIHMNKNWGSEVGMESFKAPTSVLTKPRGEFDCFGYEAEEKFSRLEGNQAGPDGYQLYRNFKMVLHNKGAKMTSMVTSTSGHTCLALDIIIMALTYMKNHMLDAIKKAVVRPLQLSQIRWVLTVPAIWSEESKKFMRTAAYWADLIPEENSPRLLIVLEPEAASIHCRTLQLHDFVPQSEAGCKVNTNTKGRQKGRQSPAEGCHSLLKTKKGSYELNFKSGDRLLVIDAGGGTLDITAHEILLNGDAKEIMKPYGGAYGGAKVDENFVTELQKILGAKFIKEYQRKHPEDWIRFIISFEKCKKAVTPLQPHCIRLPLSWLMAREFKAFTGKDIEQVFEEKKLPGLRLNYNDGTIVIEYEKVEEIFQSVIKHMMSLIKEVVSKEKKLKTLNYIFLVGGFSECRFLQQECMRTLSKYAPVLIPLSAQVAVLKGAVTFGHHPEQIKSRISRCTYGCQQERLFIDGVHDPERAKLIGGTRKCVQLFKAFVRKEDEIELGKVIRFSCKPACEGDRKIDFVLYSTYRREVTYIDEPGVEQLGQITLKSKDGPLSNDLEIRVTFGFTELVIEAVDKSSKKSMAKTTIAKTTIDFLSKATAPARYHSSRRKPSVNEKTVL